LAQAQLFAGSGCADVAMGAASFAAAAPAVDADDVVLTAPLSETSFEMQAPILCCHGTRCPCFVLGSQSWFCQADLRGTSDTKCVKA
jgi:hypothetical protein